MNIHLLDKTATRTSHITTPNHADPRGGTVLDTAPRVHMPLTLERELQALPGPCKGGACPDITSIPFSKSYL